MHYCRGSLGGHLSTAHTVEQRDFIAGHIRINAFVGKYMKLLFSYCTFFFFLSVCLAFFLSPHEILIYYCFHPSSSSLPRHTLLCSLPSLFLVPRSSLSPSVCSSLCNSATVKYANKAAAYGSFLI